MILPFEKKRETTKVVWCEPFEALIPCKNRGYEKKQTWKLKFQAARSPLYILRFESFTESALIGKLQGNRYYTANMCNTRKEIQQEKIEKKNRIRQHIAVSHIRQYMTVWGILSQ